MLRHLSIALVCVIATTLVVAEVRQNVYISTEPGGLGDVVSNGYVQPAWSSAGQTFLPENKWVLTLYAQLKNEGPERTVEFSITQSNPAKTPSYDVLLPVPHQVLHGGADPVAFDFQITCNAENKPNPEPAMFVLTYTDGSDPVGFQFEKNCTYPLLNVGITDTGSSVVHLGVPSQTWDYLARPDELDTTFYLWMDQEATFNQQSYLIKSVETSSNDVVHLSPAPQTIPDPGIASKLGFPGAVAAEIKVYYDCLNNDPQTETFVTLTLSVHWKMGKPTDIKWKWKKQCSSSYVAHPRPGLYIGTRAGHHDVVYDGRTQLDWDVHQQQVGFDKVFLDFYIWINKTDLGPMHAITQPYNMTLITDADRGGLTFYDIIAENTVGTANSDNPIHIRFRTVCKSNGKANTRIKVAFPQYYDTISFYFVKTCAFPKLQVGTIEGADKPDIIHDSTLVPAWNFVETTSQTTFYLWLPRGDTVNEQHFRVEHFGFQTDVLASASPFIQNADYARPLNLGTPEASIKWLYQCRSDAVGKQGHVNMTLDIGWNVQFNVMWFKQCGGGVTPSSGGWSAFGIFCFTVFMLTLVGCLGGCVYNRFGAGKRGFEIVPGNSYMTSLYERVAGPKKYTPQTDYSYDAAEEKGGSGYQTDL